jgi:phage-related holin
MNDYIEYIINIFVSLKNCFDLKILFSYFIIGFSFLFSVEKWEILAGLLVLIVFDYISALFAVKASGELIESRKSVCSAFKTFVYCILISASHLTDKALGITNWILTLEYATYAFLSATELISILENFGKLGYPTPKKLLNILSKYTCSEIQVATKEKGCSKKN